MSTTLDRRYAFNSIESEYKYNIWLKSKKTYDYDSQSLIQVGTDKDWVDQNPDIDPSVQTACDDTNTIWISWTGDNAAAGTQAAPKRSFLDGGYNSAGDGAITAAIAAGFDICFVEDSANMWVEAAIIPNEIDLFKYESDDTPSLRTCRRTLPNSGNFTDLTAVFVDPNDGGSDSGTQANPYTSLQTAIDNVGAKTYIIIFNNGDVGSAGDNSSLVLNECIDFNTDSVEIHVGVRWAADWFSAGDTGFINYNYLNTIETIDTTSGSDGRSSITSSAITEERFYALRAQRYLDYTNDGINFSQSDITGAVSNSLYDIEEFNNYLFVATNIGGTATIRKTNNLTWSSCGDASFSICVHLKNFNNALYAWVLISGGSYGIYKTTNGSTWSLIYTLYSSISYNTDSPLFWDNKLWFCFMGNIYTIDSNDNVQIISNEVLLQKDRNYLIAKPNDNNLYIFNYYINGATNIINSYIYKYSEGIFTLINQFTEDSSSSTTYEWTWGNFIYQDQIFIHSYDEINFIDYIFLFDGSILNIVAKDTSSPYENNQRKIFLFKGWLMSSGSGAIDEINKFKPYLISLRGDNQTIKGIELESNNLAIYGIIQPEITKTNKIIQYFNISDIIFSAIDSLVDPTITNCIIHDSQYGLKNMTTSSTASSYDKSYNLFYNISETAIEELGTGQELINNNTFDNCKIGIDYQGASYDADTAMDYNVFSRVGQPIKSGSSTDLTILNSVFPPNCILTSNIILSGCYTGIPIFRDRDGSTPDYRLQAIGDGYNLNSLGVNMGNYTTGRLGSDIHGNAYDWFGDGDAGCYVICRSIYNWYWEYIWKLNPYPATMRITPQFKSKSSFETIEGTVRKTYQSIKNRIEFSWSGQEAWSPEDIYNLLKLLSYSYKMMISYNTPDDADYTVDSQAAWLASQLRTDIIAHKVGLYSGQDNSVFTKSNMTLETNNTWIVNQWRGYWVTLLDKKDQDTGGTFQPRTSQFYIVSNTATTLTLENRNTENLDKYGASVDYTTDDLVFIISDMMVLFDTDNDISFDTQVLTGVNIKDSFPQAIGTVLAFEEIK